MTVAEFRAKLMDQLDAHAEEINAQAQANIEQYRKGKHKIRILDKDGKPVAGAKVHVDQKTHDFKFGANMFMLDEFEDPEVNQRYRETFAKYFNFGTVPIYWDGLEVPRYTAVLLRICASSSVMKTIFWRRCTACATISVCLSGSPGMIRMRCGSFMRSASRRSLSVMPIG